VLVWIKVLQKCPGSRVGSLSLTLCSLGKGRFILLQRWVISSVTHSSALSDGTIFHQQKRKTVLKLSFTGGAVAPGSSSQRFIATSFLLVSTLAAVLDQYVPVFVRWGGMSCSMGNLSLWDTEMYKNVELLITFLPRFQMSLFTQMNAHVMPC